MPVLKPILHLVSHSRGPWVSCMVPCTSRVQPHNALPSRVQLHDTLPDALQVALLAGSLYTAVGLLRLGWITNFLSHSVICGFMTGASVIIALSQVSTPHDCDPCSFAPAVVHYSPFDLFCLNETWSDSLLCGSTFITCLRHCHADPGLIYPTPIIFYLSASESVHSGSQSGSGFDSQHNPPRLKPMAMLGQRPDVREPT